MAKAASVEETFGFAQLLGFEIVGMGVCRYVIVEIMARPFKAELVEEIQIIEDQLLQFCW